MLYYNNEIDDGFFMNGFSFLAGAAETEMSQA